VRAERLELDLGTGPMPCFLASPEGWPPGPAIVVIQEWWGLNTQIEGVAGRFAQAGFAATAPDLYRGEQPTEPDDARKLAMELDRDRAADDLREVVGWLLGRGATKVAVTGFCMGGGICWTLAQTEPRLSAAVPFYGGVDFRDGERALVPFQAHYGTRDHFPEEMLEAIREHTADVPGSELHRYEGAGHAFMNEERESYRPGAAELAWSRTLEFLREHLG
jgi:carboxymethylenebutenolidase